MAKRKGAGCLARKAAKKRAKKDGVTLEETGPEDAGLGQGGDDAADPPSAEEEVPPQPKRKKQRTGGKEKGWKSVEMDFDLMKEFEMEGGCFFEEADDDFGITHGDGREEVVEAGKKKKKKKGKGDEVADIVDDDEVAVLEANVEDEVSGPKKKKKAKSKKDQAASEVCEETAAIEAEAPAAAEPEAMAEEPVDLPHWSGFDLHPAVLRGLAALGFQRPTAVQSRCLGPAIRQRKDIVGAAETGSGKTLAFGLPMLHHTLLTMAESDIYLGADGKFPMREGGVKGLVILPTRELAVQVQSHINAVARATTVRCECVVGGISSQKQRRLLARRPQIVVGTPGRLFALLGLDKEPEEKCPWFRDGLVDLRHLVLDEADRLVESGHFKELDSIVSLVYSSLQRPAQLQTFVFSATLTLDPRTAWQKKQGEGDASKVDQLMQRLKFRDQRALHIEDLTKPEELAANSASIDAARKAAEAKMGGVTEQAQGRRNGQLPERLDLQEAVVSDDKDRESVLAMWLLRRYRWNAAAGGAAAAVAEATSSVAEQAVAAASLGGRVVVFCNAITAVMRLSSILSLLLESPSAGKVLGRVRMNLGKHANDVKARGVSVDVLDLHSKMRQKDRLKRMEKFRGMQHAILVCTDIAARGLDVPEVAAVLHFQAPRGAEIFVHRSGRTARAGRSGESVSIMGPSDAMNWNKVYRASGVDKSQISSIHITANEINVAREAIKLAVELEKKVHVVHKKTGEQSWMRRTAKEADLEYSDDDEDGEEGKAAAPRRQLFGLLQQLQARVRRAPRRENAGPIPRRSRGRQPLRR